MMFERNLVKVSGFGLSAGTHAAKERAEQMKVTTDFVRILDSEADVMLEAQEAIDLEVDIPNAKHLHGTPWKKAGGRGHGSRGRRRRITRQTIGRKKPMGLAKQEEDIRKKLEEKLALAMEITDSELTTGRQNKVDNPPMVIITD